MDKEQLRYYINKLNYEIDCWDLYELLSKNEDVVVVDARSIEKYSQENIPRSINIPHRHIGGKLESTLDKSSLYVTYCDGIGCNASTKAALKLADLGFRVKELTAGLQWWIQEGYETVGNNPRQGTKLSCGC